MSICRFGFIRCLYDNLGLHNQVAVAVDFKDQTGEQQTMQQNLQNVCLKTGAPMESHAATILTPFAFS